MERRNGISESYEQWIEGVENYDEMGVELGEELLETYYPIPPDNNNDIITPNLNFQPMPGPNFTEFYAEEPGQGTSSIDIEDGENSKGDEKNAKAQGTSSSNSEENESQKEDLNNLRDEKNANAQGTSSSNSEENESQKEDLNNLRNLKDSNLNGTSSIEEEGESLGYDLKESCKPGDEDLDKKREKEIAKKNTMRNREDLCVEEILKTVVKEKKVMVMVSGGVKSTVCAAFLNKVLGAEKVTFVHIDTGFMRHQESDEVVKSLEAINVPVHRFNFGTSFRAGTQNGKPGSIEEVSLDSTTDPEAKQKIIGNTFIQMKDIIMKQLKLKKNEYLLALGTIRPDLTESANMKVFGKCFEKLRQEGEVIEPLKDFYIDEVREIGKTLGLPEELVQRHPFPAPGLAIRIICSEKEYKCEEFVTTEIKLNVLTNPKTSYESNDHKEIDQLQLRTAGMQMLSTEDRRLAEQQDFVIKCTLLPIKAVGIKGDMRSYSYVVALSTKERPIPWRLLYAYSKMIPIMLCNINRVAYVFGEEVLNSVDNITRTNLVQPIVEKLRSADKVANDVLFGNAVDHKGIQIGNVTGLTVVMIPVHFDRSENELNSFKHSFILRPIVSSDFMTEMAAEPNKHFPEKTVLDVEAAIRMNVLGVSRVLLDMTCTSPGTTEWE